MTSRFGPYSPFFHFPHNNDRDLGALHDWGWGLTDTLATYEAYAWGGPAEFTVMQASCLYTRTTVITTGIQVGSMEAFATYLHSLADYYIFTAVEAFPNARFQVIENAAHFPFYEQPEEFSAVVGAFLGESE